MTQTKKTFKTALFVVIVTFFVLNMTGCDCSKKLAPLQQQNQALTLRVAELQDQLKQSEQPTYIVCQGDSLWSIAQKQLGSGTRYKEILALNPQFNEEQPIAIGTLLKMPPK